MYCAVIESAVLEKDEVIFKGEIPACCISEYKNDLIFYTNGRSVCLTELKGYKEISGGFISQPHCPDRRLSFTNGESEATDRGLPPPMESRKPQTGLCRIAAVVRTPFHFLEKDI